MASKKKADEISALTLSPALLRRALGKVGAHAAGAALPPAPRRAGVVEQPIRDLLSPLQVQLLLLQLALPFGLLGQHVAQPDIGEGGPVVGSSPPAAGVKGGVPRRTLFLRTGRYGR